MTLGQFEPIYIAVREEEGVVVVEMRVSHLTEEDNIEHLGRELFALVDQYGRRKLILSLDAVEHVTSSVLGKMITLHRKLHRQDGTLVLCDLCGSVADVLQTSRLINYFHVVEDLPAAKEFIQNAASE